MSEVFASLPVASDQAVYQAAEGAFVDGAERLGNDGTGRQGAALGFELFDTSSDVVGGVPHSFGLGLGAIAACRRRARTEAAPAPDRGSAGMDHRRYAYCQARPQNGGGKQDVGPHRAAFCTWSYRGHGRSALSRHDLALAARTVASTQLCWHKPLSQDDRDRCRDDWQTPQFPRNQGARVVRCLLPVPAGDQSLRGAWLALVLGGIAQPHLQTREGTTPQVGSLVPRLSAPQQPACAPAAQPRLAL